MADAPLIRPATPADLPSLIERWRELITTHQQIDPALYALDRQGEATYRAFVRRLMDQRDAVVLVAPDGAEVAGYLLGSLGQRAPMFRVRAVGMIHDLAVHPERRRRGIARALVEGARAHFRRRGVTHLQVDYDPGNPEAVAFWTAIGFEPRLTEAYQTL